MDLDEHAGSPQEPEAVPTWAMEKTDLADERLGGTILFATDEWFARAESLLDPSPATFDINAYSPQGKTLDGWESRRRRLPGHDWCIIKLGLPGHILGVEIDTAFFTGNQVPRISILAAELPTEAADGTTWLPGALERASKGGGVQGTAATSEEIEAAQKAVGMFPWHELVPVTPLRPGYKDRCVHYVATPGALPRATHLRINYFPDGGVARLRVWGDVSRDFATELASAPGPIDLAAVENGGKGIGCSNQHYGVPRNLLQPGRGIHMGDGWETGRHPNRPAVITIDPKTGFSASGASDWCVIRLGAVAQSVKELRIDTKHFKGNFPESVEVHGMYSPRSSTNEVLTSAADGSDQAWFPLLGRTRLQPDSEHIFSATGNGGVVSDSGKVSHIRVTIFPDGGIMRLRVIGRAIEPISASDPAMRSKL